jgi:hypothetical protein
LSLAHGDSPPHFVICRRVKDLFFGSLGVDYSGFFSQSGYPLSQNKRPLPPGPTVLAQRDRKAQNLMIFSSAA